MVNLEGQPSLRAILRSYNHSRQGKSQLLSTEIMNWFLDDDLPRDKHRQHQGMLDAVAVETEHTIYTIWA